MAAGLAAGEEETIVNVLARLRVSYGCMPFHWWDIQTPHGAHTMPRRCNQGAGFVLVQFLADGVVWVDRKMCYSDSHFDGAVLKNTSAILCLRVGFGISARSTVCHRLMG